MTENVGDFIASLETGDVLLFDTIHPLSQLIKFAENRPVNHCAIYLGSGEFAHVGRHIPDPKRVGPPLKPAARTERLADWLAVQPGPHDRTVTALRHANVKSPSDASNVVARARSYIDPRDTTYNYLSLVSLMVPSLLRTYKSYLKDQGAMRLVAGSMRAVSRSLVDVMEQGAIRADGARARTLTCSEFVYRCFDEAEGGFGLEVTEPLGRWPDPSNLVQDNSSESGIARLAPEPGISSDDGGAADSLAIDDRALGETNGHPIVDGAGLVVFDDSFRADVLGPTDETLTSLDRGAEEGTTALGLTGTRWDLAMLAGKVIMDMIWHNKALAKYDQEAGRVSPGTVFADLVTPRDLWSSPSLSAAAVLHRPPGPDDKYLDGMPPTSTVFGD
jgi:hypothetical protein